MFCFVYYRLKQQDRNKTSLSRRIDGVPVDIIVHKSYYLRYNFDFCFWKKAFGKTRSSSSKRLFTTTFNFADFIL